MDRRRRQPRRGNQSTGKPPSYPEDRLERLIRQMGRYSRKTTAELEEIISDLDKVLDTIEKMPVALEHIGAAERARNLRTRLRNHRTRAQRAFKGLNRPVDEQAAG